MFEARTRRPEAFLISSMKPAVTPASTRYFPPVAPAWPALWISPAATDSGKGSPASSTSVRRRMITNRTPSTPPTSMMNAEIQKFTVSHTPAITKAGMVKMAPATSASPTDAVVRAMFSSRIVPAIGRRTAIATTAAGKVAAIVRPATMPMYALAAPRITAMTTPRTTALSVNSVIRVSAGT